MLKEELKVVYGSVKSYYGKAYTVRKNSSIKLYSYETLVAEIRNGQFIYLWNRWSKTTARHVNEFLQQNGFAPMSKNELIENHFNYAYGCN